jgi:diacylglycerol O-acyltransferase / wax synthase
MTVPDEPLSRADAANLQLDSGDQVNVVLVAAQLQPGGFVGADGSTDLARLRAVVAQRLRHSDAQVRRLQQRIAGSARNPVWRSCTPDLAWHIRTEDSYPGLAGLAELSGNLMTTPLPGDRPLWEMLVIPGTTQNPAAIIIRLHHCVADGVGAISLIQHLLGTPLPPSEPTSASAATPRARHHFGLRLARTTALVRTRIGPTPLLGTISQHRSVGFADVDLAHLAEGARRCQGTVNDGLLAAVALGIAEALREAGAPVPSNIQVSVPVALPDRGASGNATGVMVVDLPTCLGDPEQLVAAIAGQTRAAKHAARAQGTYEFTRSRWATRLFARLIRHQRFISSFVTNVRGPTRPLSIDGATLISAWPVTPIQGNVRLGVAAMSYAGRLNCAVHLDAEVLSAPAVTRALQRGLDQIAALPTLAQS